MNNFLSPQHFLMEANPLLIAIGLYASAEPAPDEGVRPHLLALLEAVEPQGSK